MENNIPRVWALLKQYPWAILPEKLEEIVEVVRLKAAGVDVPYEAAQKPDGARMQGVAVLPLFGVVAQRMDLFMKFSGGTSTETFTRDLRALVADPEVGAIVINIDSPGGSVFGTPELASEIFNSRGRKPIVAVANSIAASAAYWIASAANELVVTPSGEVGSIGVYALHTEFSQADAQNGVKSTFIKAGKFKTAGNDIEPLDDESRAYLQAGVDRYYDMFTAAVAKYRGAKIDDVKNGFGEGGMVGAKEAVKLGMANRVATLDETIMRLLKEQQVKANGNGQALEWIGPPPEATEDGNFIEAQQQINKTIADVATKDEAATNIDDEIKRRTIDYL